MVAVARPWVEANENVIWDEKCGIFPFTHDVPAQRTSNNRDRRIIGKKAIESITKDVIRHMLIHEALPAIRS